MTRVMFTKKITFLLNLMEIKQENPVIDFTKRTSSEQMRLFKLGLSKCDGIHNVSRHQIGRAMDILFFTDEGKVGVPKLGYEYWHEEWKKLGGAEMISWDKGHFEVEV